MENRLNSNLSIDKMFSMSQKVRINALLKKDLNEYIKNLGLSDALQEGKLKCDICTDKLTVDNIGAIFFKEHEPKFTCARPLCYQVVHETNKE